MNNHWNERYGNAEYAYGKEPNQFLADQLKNLKKGKILFPCEGEGRNAVFAAQLGWESIAFDLSEEGLKKAGLLAQQNHVSINYQIADAMTVDYHKESFDVVALIFAHFPTDIRQSIHQKIVNWLKPGGIFILEAFNPLQLNNTSGGPKDLGMLYTVEILKEDFKNLKIKEMTTLQITLDEGKYHQGNADVIRFIGIREN